MFDKKWVFIISVLILQKCVDIKCESDGEQFDQYICERSKSINKCGCHQDTGDLNIPLFTIDCSRLDFSVSPLNEQLPFLMNNLDLSHNLIEVLDNVTKLYSPTLEYLDYSYNKIKNIASGQFMNLTNLVSLNLEHNYLKHVDSKLVYGLNNLNILNLAENGLTSIPDDFFQSFVQLEALNLSNNDIGDFLFNLKAEIFPRSIQNLRLNSVGLSKITNATFSYLLEVKYLSLFDNPIEDMFILPFEKLEYLDISGTNITTIEAKHLKYPSLKELKLKRLRKLKTIGDYTFYNTTSLETLTIEYCDNLEELDPASFGFYLDALASYSLAKRYALRKLSLANNHLKSLDGRFEYLFRRLIEVNLMGNPWYCGCSISWFANQKNIINANDTRCNSPAHLKFKAVTELYPKQFVCLENKNLDSPGLPIHRWLFPVVGVLSFIVLILVMVLLYMGPFGSSISWTRSIGPESPYNRMTIDTNMEESSRHL